MAPWLLDDAMPTRFSAGFSTSATLRNVPARGDDDVRAEGQRQHRVRRGLAGRRHGDRAAQHGEVDQPVGQLRGARPDAFEAKPAVGVGRRRCARRRR